MPPLLVRLLRVLRLPRARPCGHPHGHDPRPFSVFLACLNLPRASASGPRQGAACFPDVLPDCLLFSSLSNHTNSSPLTGHLGGRCRSRASDSESSCTYSSPEQKKCPSRAFRTVPDLGGSPLRGVFFGPTSQVTFSF